MRGSFSRGARRRIYQPSLPASARPNRLQRTMKLEHLEHRMVLAANPVISEIMASNATTLADEDGEFSDWIELLNAGDMPADMNGWFLTDDAADLDKWRFPAVTLEPNQFLVVFASNKDRIDPAGELHTNFRMSSGGEFLALVRPDGRTVGFAYSPRFPEQQVDVSYGLPQEFTTRELVASGAAATAIVPTDDSLGANWQNQGFDDSAWQAGTTGLGFERVVGYEPFIGLDVGDQMWSRNASAYLRVPFEVANPAQLSTLTLRMMYDDGFVAYINGTEVARRNAPEVAAWNSEATAAHSDGLARQFEDIDIIEHLSAIQAGTNVLAIHGLNLRPTDNDFLIGPELTSVVQGEVQMDTRHYLFAATPGAANGVGSTVLVEPVEFSVPGGVFTEGFDLVLSTATPGATIRYTTDGSEPSNRSREYTTPLAISMSTSIRAKAFAEDVVSRQTAIESYVLIDNTVANFSSDLPVVVLENFGGLRPPTSGFQPMTMSIFEQQGDGRTVLTSDPTLITHGGIRVRGSSTAGREKASYAIEAWDNNNDDKPISPLGFPEESDWILYAAYNFDLALMRNPLAYDLSNQVGRYAVRTRFVEVYFNINGGPVSQADYVGVYSFMEKIKRDPNRVDIEELSPSHIQEPEITGGYILKIDRADPGDTGFGAAGQTIRYVEPKEEEIERVPAQQTWIRDHFNAFGAALNGPNYADPDLGYAQYIDVDSWIDHHILNVLPMNVDAFRLSGYFYKDRGGKIEMGPVWDFDRSMGSTDGRDANPRAWNGTGDATRFFEYPWWSRLFQDSNFMQKWIDRWTELRSTVLSTENINATIDGMADEIREAQVRNYARWTGVRPRFGGFQGEIDHLKQWLQDRAEWIDSQFLAAPAFSHQGGQVDPGFNLRIASEIQNVYYTLDGSDPRLPGGGVNPTAIQAERAGEVVTLITTGAAASAVIPTDGSLGQAWTQVGFDASGWKQGATGVGYERSFGYDPLIDLDVQTEMFSTNASAFIRVPFQVSDPAALSSLILKMKYDDGFVAYINGTEVARRNAPDGVPAWNAAATEAHSDSAAQVFEEIDISAHLSLLQSGDNVLAIHGLNDGSGDADFLILPELGTDDALISIVTLDESAKVRARAVRRADWSGLAEGTFLVGPPAELRVTEIMYHPRNPQPGSPFGDDDFEFIELQNAGATTLALGGFKFTDGIDFTFPDMDLEPGGVVVVVANPQAFVSRYGPVANVIGQFTGQLNNAGEHLLLAGALDETLLDFTYQDEWYPETDGDGQSLVIRNVKGAANTWGLSTSWKPSGVLDGTPGVADPPRLPGDTNGDGRVDIDDLNAVRNNFGGSGEGDANGDGIVDIDDLNLVRNNFGAGGPQPLLSGASALPVVARFERPAATPVDAPSPLQRNARTRLATLTSDVAAATDRLLSDIRFDRPQRRLSSMFNRASRGHQAAQPGAWDDALVQVTYDRFDV